MTRTIHPGHDDPERSDRKAITILVPINPENQDQEHMLAFGPVVMIHTAENAPLNADNPGHAFGPFMTVGDAVDFAEEVGEDGTSEHEDHCVKTIIPLRATGMIGVISLSDILGDTPDPGEPYISTRLN